MASEKYQETNHKTSQRIWYTSLLLQTDIGSRTSEQPDISCVQWKLRGGNENLEGNPPRLWFRISIHHQN